jgi:hypothetical protein
VLDHQPRCSGRLLGVDLAIGRVVHRRSLPPRGRPADSAWAMLVDEHEDGRTTLEGGGLLSGGGAPVDSMCGESRPLGDPHRVSDRGLCPRSCRLVAACMDWPSGGCCVCGPLAAPRPRCLRLAQGQLDWVVAACGGVAVGFYVSFGFGFLLRLALVCPGQADRTLDRTLTLGSPWWSQTPTVSKGSSRVSSPANTCSCLLDEAGAGGLADVAK